MEIPASSLVAAKTQEPEQSSVFANSVALLAVLLYLVSICRYARRVPLWMDEVLTLWTVRQPGVAAIYRALESGAQATPPGHPVLLYFWQRIAGDSYLALRLPSIAAGLLAALAIFVLLRRYLHPGVAVLGLSLCLSGELYRFNLQVRPYAFTVACFAVAILLWDDLARKPNSSWRLSGIVLLLSTAIAMHFYSCFYLVSFGLIELLYSLSLRRFRPRVWIALVVSGLSVAFWLPLMHQLRKLLQAEGGAHYYAVPSFIRLVSIAHEVMVHPQVQKPLVIGLGFLTIGLLFAAAKDIAPAARERILAARPLFAVAVGCAALPIVTFLFARITHGAFNDRYVLPAALGGALLICIAAEFLPFRATVAPLTALLLALTSLRVDSIQTAVPVDYPAVLAQSGSYPLVFAEGLIFFEARETRSLSPQQKNQFTYLTLPSSYPFLDSTNEHLLEKWKTIDPALHVADADAFLRAHPCLYVFDTHRTADDLTDYLRQRGLLPRSSLTVGGGTLDLVCSATSR